MDQNKRQSIIHRLKEIESLKSLREPELDQIARLSEIREYAADEEILAEGSFDGWVYFLLSGKVRILKNGRELFVLSRTGDVFGEMGVVNNAARSASIHAVEPTRCLAVDLSDISAHPADQRCEFRYLMYKEIAEALARRLRATTEELVRTRELAEDQSRIIRRLQEGTDHRG